MFDHAPDAAFLSKEPTAILMLTDEVVADVNSDDLQLLYVNPAESGRYFYCTGIHLYEPSTSLTTASISVGTTSTAYADIAANATHTTLDGSTKFKRLSTTNGAVRVAPGASVYLKNNTKQGGAATVCVRLEGFLAI